MNHVRIEKNKAYINTKGCDFDSSEAEMIIEIKKCNDGMVRFEEQCDSHFSVKRTKKESIEMLQEMIEFIKG